VLIFLQKLKNDIRRNRAATQKRKPAGGGGVRLVEVSRRRRRSAQKPPSAGTMRTPTAERASCRPSNPNYHTNDKRFVKLTTTPTFPTISQTPCTKTYCHMPA